MKILFLDIDGVVNCVTTFQRHRGAIGIDPEMAFRIGQIVIATGCEIVLSSTWRLFEPSREEVRKQVYPFIDVTPNMPKFGGAEMCERGYEIKDWLDRHPEVKKYAILDDNSDMLPEQFPNFFKTSWSTGITEDIKQQVIDHLNREDMLGGKTLDTFDSTSQSVNNSVESVLKGARKKLKKCINCGQSINQPTPAKGVRRS